MTYTMAPIYKTIGDRHRNCRFRIPLEKLFSVVHEANEKLTDKNLFAYCDNNPVMRKDGGGEFWTVLAGAVIGAITNVAATVISNAASGSEPAIGKARQKVISARGTLGSAICGTAKGTNVKKAWSSYIGANINLLQKTKEHLLPTTMLYAGGLIYGTMGKQMNHSAWKQVGPMLKGQKR